MNKIFKDFKYNKECSPTVLLFFIIEHIDYFKEKLQIKDVKTLISLLKYCSKEGHILKFIDSREERIIFVNTLSHYFKGLMTRHARTRIHKFLKDYKLENTNSDDDLIEGLQKEDIDEDDTDKSFTQNKETLNCVNEQSTTLEESLNNDHVEEDEPVFESKIPSNIKDVLNTHKRTMLNNDKQGEDLEDRTEYVQKVVKAGLITLDEIDSKGYTDFELKDLFHEKLLELDE